jgi:phosphatidylglycerophosphate synthase
MLANWITLLRFPLLLVNILILYFGSPAVRLAGVGLLFVGLMLDTVDGIVARKTGQSSLFGSVLDIAADRTYELVLWVCFADLGMIPLAIPLVIIARTTLMRCAASAWGRERRLSRNIGPRWGASWSARRSCVRVMRSQRC